MKAACETPAGQFAYLAPLYTQVKKTAWDALKLASAAPNVKVNEAELRVDFPNGARIQLFGADNYDALRGLHLNGIVLDEYAQMHPQAWDAVIRPALSIRTGFAIFIGTPSGRNQFYKLYKRVQADPSWFTALYRWHESGVFDERPEEIADAQASMTPEMFAQEYECSFETAIHGAYYATELRTVRAEGRIRLVAWEPAIPVHTWWDMGNIDATSIIFEQQVGHEIHVIDYLEATRQTLADYAKALANRPYLYGDHHLPHDAGAQRLDAGGVSMARQLQNLGVRNVVVGKPSEPLEGINAARLLFGRMWFDETKCERLLECLDAYHAAQDPKHQTEKPQPEHDWSSHAADAFRYMALGVRYARSAAPTTPRYARSGLVDYRDTRQAGAAARYAAGSLS